MIAYHNGVMELRVEQLWPEGRPAELITTTDQKICRYAFYLSSVEGPNRREKPLRRWEDTVKEYMSDRGVRGIGLEWKKREIKGYCQVR